MNPVVTVAAVAENREPMLREVHWLFHSLRTFGGALADARAIVYFVDSLPRETRHLEALGVEIRQVRTIDDRSPHSNKIHMLLDRHDTEWLVAMDTDTVIMGDFSEQLERPVFAAKIVDTNPLSEALWARLYGYFDLALPGERYQTHFTGDLSNPYFNSGMLLVPRTEVARLGETWLGLVPQVIAVYERDPELAKHAFFTDQFALALAVSKTGMDYRTLPLEMNFPTHYPVHESFVTQDMAPFVIHHHHMIDPGGRLEHCDHASVNQLIDRFNASLDAPNHLPHPGART